MITAKQRDLIQDKYGDLIYKIAYQISGDAATCSFEDNVQDLWIAALEAVRGFEIQNGGANGKFDDFWGSQGFDKYIKTCLWSAKNSKGAKVTKKINLYKGNVPIHDYTEVFEIDDRQTTTLPMEVQQLFDLLNEEQRLVLNTVVKDPNLILESGRINCSAVGRKLGYSHTKASQVVKSMHERLDEVNERTENGLY